MSDPQSPEFRTDVLTDRCVLVAPLRSLRPSAFHPDPPLSRLDDPFAEGHESETPDERFALRDPASAPNAPGWKLRVVPNRYPAVTEQTQNEMPADSKQPGANSTAPSIIRPTTDSPSQLFPSTPAYGEHDVVIECPNSRSRLADLSVDEVKQVLVAWQTRLRQLASSHRFSSVAIFRNEGFSAGASLAHCHSQIIACEQLTPLDAIRHSIAAQHRHATGRELIADLLTAERADGRRMICETSHFAVVCPFAPQTSWHVRFIPLTNSPLTFDQTTDESLRELAELLKMTLGSLEQSIGGPFAFNITLPHPQLDQPAEFRWMLDLLPRTGRTAGWEFLSNVDIITTSPEAAAQTIRRAAGCPDFCRGQTGRATIEATH